MSFPALTINKTPLNCFICRPALRASANDMLLLTDKPYLAKGDDTIYTARIQAGCPKKLLAFGQEWNQTL